MVTMRLHRSGVVLAVVFALLIAILIFAAGYLVGMSRGVKIALAKPAVPKIATPKLPTAKLPTAKLPALPNAKAPAAASATAAAATDSAAPLPEPTLAIRAGVFPVEDDAKALVQRLTASKLDATVLPVATESGPTLYMVLVGRYASRAEAAAAAAELGRRQGLDTAVVPLP
jgi:cell division septation protein DedD